MATMVAAESQIPPIAHAVAGSLGSSLALLLFYPLERARIEMQSKVSSEVNNRNSILQSDEDGVQQRNRSESPVFLDSESEPIANDGPSSSVSVQSQREADPHTLMACFYDLLKRGEMYKGAKPIVATLAASNFVFFYMNEFMKRLLLGTSTNHNRDKMHSVRLLIASCIAGIINVLMTNPLWVTNLKIVSGSTQSDSLLKELQLVAKEGGINHLYKGTWTSILLVSNPVIQFFTYEQLKSQWRKPSALNFFLMGAMAKTLSTVVTYPLQLAQAVLRMDQQQGGGDPLQHSKYRGTLDCLLTLYKKGGLFELFTGMKAKLLQTVLTASFTFLTYEQILAAVVTAIRSSKRPGSTKRIN